MPETLWVQNESVMTATTKSCFDIMESGEEAVTTYQPVRFRYDALPAELHVSSPVSGPLLGETTTPYWEAKLTRIQEVHLGLTGNSSGPVIMNPRWGYPVGGFSYQTGEQRRIYRTELGLLHHFSDGRWTLAVHWALGEAVRIDTIDYVNAVMYAPWLRFASLLGSWLTPSVELQRNLSPSHSLKLFAGLDITPASNYASYEEYVQPEDDWFDGILYSPSVGIQAHIWAVNARIYTSADFWDRFNRRHPSYDPSFSIGWSLRLGPEFRTDRIPCACNERACKKDK